jgi:hypothetical protein
MPESNWRLAADEMPPKDGTKFLAFTHHGDFELGEYYEVMTTDYIEGADGRFDKVERVYADGWNCNAFTHWMPLPPAPEDKDDV